MIKFKQHSWLIGAAVLMFALFSAQNSFSADVDVYAEGAYTDTDLVVYLYADINAENILSCGVKLTYNPIDLSVSSASKNESVWFMGDGTTNHAYMEPDTSNPGEIVYILGKLDTNAPTEGVAGTRVKLGEVVFNRLNTNMPNISLSIGKPTPFDNVVTVGGSVLDDTGVAFLANTVVERGDANADGTIDIRDIRALRQGIGSPDDASIWVDCNGDGSVDIRDVRCLRQKM